MNPKTTGIFIGLSVFAIDQCTKTIVLSSPEFDEDISVAPVLSLVRFQNEGISFGLLDGSPPWLLSTGATIVVVALLCWLWRTADRLLAAALGLVLGGALGNIADRLLYGAVTDFLDFHIANYHWPAFNFADSMIVCGVFLVLISECRALRRGP